MEIVIDALMWALVRMGYGLVRAGELLEEHLGFATIASGLNWSAEKVLELLAWLEEKRMEKE